MQTTIRRAGTEHKVCFSSDCCCHVSDSCHGNDQKKTILVAAHRSRLL